MAGSPDLPPNRAEWARLTDPFSMDQFVLDLGNVVAAAGDEVPMFGPGDRIERAHTS